MRVNSSLYWEQVPGSLCGSRSGSSSSIWGRVTRANAWPLHWPTEWRCLGLGTLICGLTHFSGDSRIRITGLRRQVLLKLPESLIFFEGTFWPFGSWPGNPTFYRSLKCSLSLVLLAPKEHLSKSMCCWDIGNFLTTPIAPLAPVVISPVLLPEPRPTVSTWRNCLFP